MQRTLRSLAVALLATLSLAGYAGEAAEALARARALVRELEAGPDAARDATMRRLAALGPGALPAIQEAAGSPKAEVARRAQELATIWQRYARLREEAIEDTDEIDAAAEALAQAGPLAFDALVAAYAAEPTGNWRLREQVVNLAARLDPQRALGFFQTLLAEDREYDNAYVVLPRLGEMGGKEVVPLILSALLHKDSHTQYKAGEALGKVGEPAVGPLLELLQSKDPEHRARAAEALGQLDGFPRLSLASMSKVVAALGRARDDPDPKVQAAATVAFMNHAPDGFKSCFAHRSATVRAAAVYRSGGMCEQYIQALRDPSPEVREAAARRLDREKGPRVVAALIEALDDDSPKVLLRVLDALGGRRRDPVPNEKILRIARDGQRPEEVRAEALGALASLGGAPAMEALLGMAQDPLQPERIRLAAASNVLKIEHPRVTEFARKLVRDKELRAKKPDHSVYPCTMEFLGELELGFVEFLCLDNLASVAIGYLMRAGDPTDAELVVAEAIGSGLGPAHLYQLAKMGKRALPTLERAATQGQEAVRLAAVGACQNLKGAEAVALAVRALKDPSATVRAGAANTLGLLKDKSAAPALVPLLEDKDEMVQVVAATTLVILGDGRAKAQAAAFHKRNFQLGRRSASHWYDMFESASFLVKHIAHKGMTKAQVEEVIGYPPGTTGKANPWVYSIGRGCFASLEFVEGKLVRIDPGWEE